MNFFLINKEFPCWNWCSRKFLIFLCKPARPGSQRKIRNFLLRLSAEIVLLSFPRQTLGTAGSFYEPWHCRFVFRTSCVCSKMQTPPIQVVSTRKKFILKNKKFFCVERVTLSTAMNLVNRNSFPKLCNFS